MTVNIAINTEMRVTYDFLSRSFSPKTFAYLSACLFLDNVELVRDEFKLMILGNKDKLSALSYFYLTKLLLTQSVTDAFCSL